MKTTSKLIIFIFTFLALTASAYAESPNIPKAGPMMNKELMARMIKFAREQKDNGAVTGKICAIFNLCDGSKDMPLKLIQSEHPEGTFFGLPVDESSRDILIMRKHDGIVEAYLTDKSGKLRAAAVADGKPVAHLITNEKAAEKYEAVLRDLAREAAEDLPPSVITAPGNK